MVFFAGLALTRIDADFLISRSRWLLLVDLILSSKFFSFIISFWMYSLIFVSLSGHFFAVKKKNGIKTYRDEITKHLALQPQSNMKQ
jgi:hypothetical protein